MTLAKGLKGLGTVEACLEHGWRSEVPSIKDERLDETGHTDRVATLYDAAGMSPPHLPGDLSIEEYRAPRYWEERPPKVSELAPVLPRCLTTPTCVTVRVCHHSHQLTTRR